MKKIRFYQERWNRLHVQIFPNRVFVVLISVFYFSLLGSGIAIGQDELSFQGITEPITDVMLSLHVEGRISKLSFKEGEKVNEKHTRKSEF